MTNDEAVKWLKQLKDTMTPNVAPSDVSVALDKAISDLKIADSQTWYERIKDIKNTSEYAQCIAMIKSLELAESAWNGYRRALNRWIETVYSSGKTFIDPDLAQSIAENLRAEYVCFPSSDT